MKGFIFDINKCVGCHACVVACSVENEDKPLSNWRNIHTYNKNTLPLLPVFNLSLACNHCEEAACLEACPANAYSFDQYTGAVIFNKDVCIGCKYCTWACPYDAPKYDEISGLVSKCTFCNNRLIEGGIPACSRNCPTGALGYDEIKDDHMAKSAQGFPKSFIQPRIRFISSGNRKGPEVIPQPVSKQNIKSIASELDFPDSKISLKREWTLLVFTLLVPLFVGTFAGILAGYIFINPWLFSFIGVIGLFLSTLHLGRKSRAIYALRNLKTSWLSREVFFYGAFLSSIFLFYFLVNLSQWLGFIAMIFGGLCLYAMDRVYKYFKQDGGIIFDSSSTFLSGLLWISLILQEPVPLFFVIGIKTVLYIYKAAIRWKSENFTSKLMASVRIFLLLVLPVILYTFSSVSILYLFFPLYLGEVLDRMQFYLNSYIDSPQREQFNEFKIEFDKKYMEPSLENQDKKREIV